MTSRERIEQYIKDRFREWCRANGFADDTPVEVSWTEPAGGNGFIAYSPGRLRRPDGTEFDGYLARLAEGAEDALARVLGELEPDEPTVINPKG